MSRESLAGNQGGKTPAAALQRTQPTTMDSTQGISHRQLLVQMPARGAVKVAVAGMESLSAIGGARTHGTRAGTANAPPSSPFVRQTR